MEETEMLRDIRIIIDEMKFKLRKQRRMAEDSILKADLLQIEVIRLEDLADRWGKLRG